jgi:hypothetical protein
MTILRRAPLLAALLFGFACTSSDCDVDISDDDDDDDDDDDA